LPIVRRYICAKLFIRKRSAEMLESQRGSCASRRTFIRNAAAGVAGAAVALSGAEGVLAAIKDSGEVTLDGLLITYFSAPLGTSGSASYTFTTAYTATLGFVSLANPDISLRAGISDDQQRINGGSLIAQTESRKIDNAITLFPRPGEDEFFTTATPPPGMPENTVFFGLRKPVLSFKGNGSKAQFRLVDAEIAFTALAKNLKEFFNSSTADSMMRQYVSDPSALTEPRFVLIQTTSGGDLTVTQIAERGAPRDITSVVTARIIEQTGFSSDVLKQAFAVGSDLEITHYSAQESKGPILRLETNLQPSSPGITRIFWDRVFKTFVIV
jgi:hypothetical protein